MVRGQGESAINGQLQLLANDDDVVSVGHVLVGGMVAADG